MMRFLLPAFLATAACLVACGGNPTPNHTDLRTAQPGQKKSSDSGAAPADAPPTSPPQGAAAMPISANPFQFGVKSGMFVFEEHSQSDDGLGPDIVILFDDYGAKMKFSAGPGNTNATDDLVFYFDNGYQTAYSTTDHRAYKGTSTDHNIMSAGYLPPQPVLENLRKQNRLHDLGTRTILGREAHGFSIEGDNGPTTYWEWKRIPLLIETGKPVTETMTVKKLDTDIPITPEMVELPKDANITDIDALRRAQQDSMAGNRGNDGKQK
ncbi:MAG: hypothetical protein ABIR47_10765 [Candidatus Kapaibacterium sp.]